MNPVESTRDVSGKTCLQRLFIWCLAHLQISFRYSITHPCTLALGFEPRDTEHKHM